MKVKIFVSVVIGCLLQFTMNAQEPLPIPYSGIPVSYVRSWDVMVQETNPNALMSRPLKDVKQTTNYVDGLGRPLQIVSKQGSLETTTGAIADIVTPTLYDAYGRNPFQYLPFAASTSDGVFKSDPYQQQVSFYNTYLAGQAGETNVGTDSLNWAYNKTNFEVSPLSRVTESFSAGVSWVGTSGNANVNDRHSVKAKHWNNTATDNVKIWTVIDNPPSLLGSYAVTGTYPAGTLIKEVTIDEKNNQVIEFKNFEGKIILRKVQLTAAPDAGTGADYTNWLCTYYLYDDLQNLRCVVQPEGVKWLVANNWAGMTVVVRGEQCFQYQYDARNRMIVKKVPGASEIFMVYDQLDRMVMMQDATLRTAGKWMVTKYDHLDRPIETGLLTNATTFTTHLSSAYSSTSYPATTSGYEPLTITHYDDYAGLPPGLSSSLLTSWDSHFAATNNNEWPYPQMPAASSAVKGMVTWTQSKVLGSSQFLSSVSIYDLKLRVVQQQTVNVTNGIDVLTTQYSWHGQPLTTVQVQQKSGSNAQTTTIVTNLTYDDLGRLVKTEKKAANSLVNNGAMPGTFKTTAQLQYDKLGKLKTKIQSPAGGPGGTPIETLNHDYNIRGSLIGINKAYLSSGTVTSAYFGMEMNYDKDGYATMASKQYDGNIGTIAWRSRGDGERRKYDFDYDATGRIMKADFNQQFGTQWLKTDPSSNFTINFSLQMGNGTDPNTAYNANGNIIQLNQWGLQLNASPQIDALTYTYQSNNSNKLVKVVDLATATPNGKLGDFKDGTNTADDYLYYPSGNLIMDNNKGISQITYNHLNLPEVITLLGKGTITYTYDALGFKVKKVANETNATVPFNGTNYTTNISTTILYVNDFVYESKSYSNAALASLNYTEVLQFFPHEEGRIRFKAGNLHYDYMIEDNLGNVRMILTEEQQVDKYPVASLEDAKLATEVTYYTIDNSKIVPNNAATNLPTYTNDNGIGNNPSDPAFEGATSQKLYQLNSNTNKLGLGIALKVMAGDKIDIHGTSYWFQANTGGSAANVAPAVLDLLNGLLGSPGNVAGGHTTAAELNGISVVNTPAGAFISDAGRNNPTYPTRPKAFINYIFLDEQFRPAGGGFSAVNNTNGIKDHFSELQNISVPKNGYVYVYVSNESPVNVFFDKLQIVHTRGRILEENHYYPFGLTMAGISSKAFGTLNSNKEKFQSQEFTNDLNVGYYEFRYRLHDPQIGRFLQIDPLASKYSHNSTYAFSENKVTSHIELEGLESLNADLSRGFLRMPPITPSRTGAPVLTLKASVEYKKEFLGQGGSGSLSTGVEFLSGNNNAVVFVEGELKGKANGYEAGVVARVEYGDVDNKIVGTFDPYFKGPAAAKDNTDIIIKIPITDNGEVAINISEGARVMKDGATGVKELVKSTMDSKFPLGTDMKKTNERIKKMEDKAKETPATNTTQSSGNIFMDYLRKIFD